MKLPVALGIVIFLAAIVVGFITYAAVAPLGFIVSVMPSSLDSLLRLHSEPFYGFGVGLGILGVVLVFNEAVTSFSHSSAAIFRLAHKSDRDEFSLYLKLVALGLVVVGVIGFLIKLVGNLFFG
jgi:protein translocase SEC61 complex gamma subunit